MADYYQILEIPDTASHSEIKAAFKRLAVKYHPDKNQGDPDMEERFKEINEAYQILSNPYSKSRYDLSRTSGYTEIQYETPAPRRYPPRRPPEPEIDWKENWMATLYALGFTALIALILTSLFVYSNYKHDQKIELLLAERRIIFKEAKEIYNQNEYEKAYLKIDRMGVFMNSETDIQAFKNQIIKDFHTKASQFASEGNYSEAIQFHELLEKYSTNYSLDQRMEAVRIYRALGQFQKAIQTLTYLAIKDYQKLDTYLMMALIARDDLKDMNQAATYFEAARKYAENSYRSRYGDAYSILIEKKHLPKSHYQVFTGLADAYHSIGAYEKSFLTTKWNMQMWPDSASNYAIAAKSKYQLGDTSEACFYLKEAKKLGFKEPLKFSCP